MKALFFVLIASLFAAEFQDIEEDEIKLGKIIKKVAPVVIKKVVPMIPKVGPIIAPFLAEEDGEDEVKFSIKLEIHNEDMFAPEFDEIDDELKIKIGSIIKKILPVVVPKIPYVGPIIAPFLSEEDMEPEVIEYDQDELAELVLAELAEEYEIDAGFWKKIGGFVKKVAPTVIKKLVPMIPKVGPIIAPFLGEEDSDEMVMNMTNPFSKKKIHWKPCPKPINGTKPHPRPHPKPHPRPINGTKPHPRPHPKPHPRPHPKPINGTKPHPKFRPLPPKIHKRIKKVPKPTVEAELDEIKIGNIIKTVAPVVIKKLVPLIPKVGPIIAPFLGEEDSDEIEVSAEMEELILTQFAEQLIEEGFELDEGFLKKIGAYLKPRIPQIIRTLVPMIPKVGPKIAPIIEPFLAEEDAEMDEIKIKTLVKKVTPIVKKYGPSIIKKVVPMIPKVGPIIAPFLAEEDSDEILASKFHLLLAEDDEEFDDEFKIKLGSIVKKVLPIVAPHIPVVGPYIAPFLSEEDAEYMEDTADVYEPEIIDAVLAELIEEGYELDEGFLKKIGAYLKPRIPQIIRTVVPLIPKVGPKIAPFIEPFLAEEETDEVKCFCILAICTC